MKIDHDAAPAGHSPYGEARLRAAQLVEAYPETGMGSFWYRAAEDLLALALYASATDQGVSVPEVDLPALGTLLIDREQAVEWLTERSAQLETPGRVGVLTAAPRTQDAAFQTAIAVLTHQIPAESESESETDDEDQDETADGAESVRPWQPGAGSTD